MTERTHIPRRPCFLCSQAIKQDDVKVGKVPSHGCTPSLVMDWSSSWAGGSFQTKIYFVGFLSNTPQKKTLIKSSLGATMQTLYIDYQNDCMITSVHISLIDHQGL